MVWETANEASGRLEDIFIWTMRARIGSNKTYGVNVGDDYVRVC